MYKIYPTEGSRLNYTLNIIDTPGFGDTTGIERDITIVGRIHTLFSTKILFIDAVCFVVKGLDERLKIPQRYVFNAIVSLFGRDMEPNICTLLTFADGAEPAVLASLDESNIHFGEKFKFNNSALFAENQLDAEMSLSQMFWEIGCKCFDIFFKTHYSIKNKKY